MRFARVSWHRHFAQSDAGEVAVGQVHPYFTLQYVEAPIAYVLEKQEPQNHVRWRLRAAFGGTVFVPFALGFKYLDLAWRVIHSESTPQILSMSVTFVTQGCD